MEMLDYKILCVVGCLFMCIVIKVMGIENRWLRYLTMVASCGLVIFMIMGMEYLSPKEVENITPDLYNIVMTNEDNKIIEFTDLYEIHEGDFLKDEQGNIQMVIVESLNNRTYRCTSIKKAIEDPKIKYIEIIEENEEESILKFSRWTYLNEGDLIGEKYKVIKEIDSKTYLVDKLE